MLYHYPMFILTSTTLPLGLLLIISTTITCESYTVWVMVHEMDVSTLIGKLRGTIFTPLTPYPSRGVLMGHPLTTSSHVGVRHFRVGFDHSRWDTTSNKERPVRTLPPEPWNLYPPQGRLTYTKVKSQRSDPLFVMKTDLLIPEISESTVIFVKENNLRHGVCTFEVHCPQKYKLRPTSFSFTNNRDSGDRP